LLRKNRVGVENGVLGSVFRRAQPTFGNSVNLRKLLSLIDQTDWTALDFDPNAARLEGLNTEIGLDPANGERDPDPRRQVFRFARWIATHTNSQPGERSAGQQHEPSSERRCSLHRQ
jgi:hypothetical protein